MKKVLIITYFFPPGNFPGSWRTYSWAQHLHKSGYYPIVVTRHWEGTETDFTSVSTEKEIIKEEYPHYTLYRLPYKGSLRDRIINRFGHKANFFGKVFSFFQIIAQNYFLWSVPFSNFYHFSKELIKNDPEINWIIASGRPFVLFRFCHLLKQEFPYLHWMADYRDAWNTASTINFSLQRRIQRFFEKTVEKKWLQNVSMVTAVSKGIAQGVSGLIGKPLRVINNGFEPSDFSKNDGRDSTNGKESFKIVYSGSLYPWQAVGDFLEAFRIVSASSGKIKPELIFLGTTPNGTLTGFMKSNLQLNIKILPKTSRDIAIENLQQADLLLMLGHKNRKGILSSKIFDYLGNGKPVFLCATVDEELTDIIRRTGAGFIAKGQEEIQVKLQEVFNLYLENGFVPFQPVEKEVMFFTREHQVRRLAEAMEKLQG